MSQPLTSFASRPVTPTKQLNGPMRATVDPEPMTSLAMLASPGFGATSPPRIHSAAVSPLLMHRPPRADKDAMRMMSEAVDTMKKAAVSSEAVQQAMLTELKESNKLKAQLADALQALTKRVSEVAVPKRPAPTSEDEPAPKKTKATPAPVAAASATKPSAEVKPKKKKEEAAVAAATVPKEAKSEKKKAGPTAIELARQHQAQQAAAKASAAAKPVKRKDFEDKKPATARTIVERLQSVDNHYDGKKRRKELSLGPVDSSSDDEEDKKGDDDEDDRSVKDADDDDDGDDHRMSAREAAHLDKLAPPESDADDSAANTLLSCEVSAVPSPGEPRSAFN